MERYWGNVKSLNRKVFNGRVYYTKLGQKLKVYPDKDGYFCLHLAKNKKQSIKKVHRLVAQTFIGNPENKPQVNHKNGIKTDNRVENLEWVTGSENMRHAYVTGLMTSEKPVLQIDRKSKKIINKFKSMNEAERETGILETHISQCCNGKVKTTKGYIWRYNTGMDTSLDDLKINDYYKKEVFQIDKESKEIIKQFDSMKEAEKQTGILKSNISNCCKHRQKTAGGYIWKYAEDEGKR